MEDKAIHQIREANPIADVVREYGVELAAAGRGNLKGLCPFHPETAPSFSVTPARGYWYCFGCSEGGDVISFVRQKAGLTFAAAVQRLAARAGIDAPPEVA